MFDGFKKEFWINKQTNKLKSNISQKKSYILFLKNRIDDPFIGFNSNKDRGLSVVKFISLKNKEKTIIGTGKSTSEKIIEYSYEELFKLSKIVKYDLIGEKDLIEYLFLLNNNVNEIEEKIDNEIIEIVNQYEKNIKTSLEQKNKNLTLLETINNNIDFKEYELLYKIQQIKLKRFLKYFKKNTSNKVFEEYSKKINLRKWEEIYLKIEKNINIKNTSLSKIKQKNKTNNKVLDYQFQYETILSFSKKEKINEINVIKIIKSYLEFVYILSITKNEIENPSILVNKFYNFLITSKDENIKKEFKHFQENILKFKLDERLINIEIEIKTNIQLFINLINEMKNNNINYKYIFKIDEKLNCLNGYAYNIKIINNKIILNYLKVYELNINNDNFDDEYYSRKSSSNNNSNDNDNIQQLTNITTMLSWVG
jgi:hypothetical protein